MSTGILVAILTVGGSLLLCVVVGGIVFISMRNQAYSGVVVKKLEDEREGADDASYTAYILVVKTDDGKQRQVTVGKKIWEQFSVGDKILKEAGKFNPTKA